MFIGKFKIKNTTELPDGRLSIDLKEHGQITMEKSLFQLISTEKALENSSVTDAVGHIVATKFLQELANYGLDYYFVEHIGTRMGVLAHNLREELIRKTFDCTGGDAINLKKLI